MILKVFNFSLNYLISMKRIAALTLCIIISLSSSLGWIHASIAQDDHLRKLEAIEAFVINQYDDKVGLVRESHTDP